MLLSRLGTGRTDWRRGQMPPARAISIPHRSMAVARAWLVGMTGCHHTAALQRNLNVMNGRASVRRRRRRQQQYRMQSTSAERESQSKPMDREAKGCTRLRLGWGLGRSGRVSGWVSQ